MNENTIQIALAGESGGDYLRNGWRAYVIKEIQGYNSLFSSYQIGWDGWSVWVNAPVCIGRLGPMRGEVYYSGQNNGDVVTREGFTSWCERIFKTFGIEVPEEARPQWSKKGSQA